MGAGWFNNLVYVMIDNMLGTLAVVTNHSAGFNDSMFAADVAYIQYFIAAWCGCFCGLIFNYVLGLMLRSLETKVPAYINPAVAQDLFKGADTAFRKTPIMLLLLLAPLPYFGGWLMVVAGIARCSPTHYMALAGTGFAAKLVLSILS